MSKARVITNFSRYSDSDLETLSEIVLEACTDNPNFTFSSNLIATIKALLLLFRERLFKASSRDRAMIFEKNETRLSLLDIMRKLAMEVNAIAYGDEVKLLSTKIPLAGAKAIHKIKGMVTGLEIINTNILGMMKGYVDVPTPRGNGTVWAYIEESLATDNINDWHQIFTNGHTVDITGLKSGVKYKFCAAYKGADGETLIWCPAITVRVL